MASWQKLLLKRPVSADLGTQDGATVLNKVLTGTGSSGATPKWLSTGTVTSVSASTGLSVSNATTTPNISLRLQDLTDLDSSPNGSSTYIPIYISGQFGNTKKVLLEDIDLSEFNDDLQIETSASDWTATEGVTRILNKPTIAYESAIPVATASQTGLVTATQITKLDSIVVSAITANTAKVGITSGQASAITANTAKTGITSGQASAITANTAKTGISSAQASAITANTAKIGISSSQGSAITANTAKIGITSGQASAITANTIKVSNVQSDWNALTGLAKILNKPTIPQGDITKVTFASGVTTKEFTTGDATIIIGGGVGINAVYTTATDSIAISGISASTTVKGIVELATMTETNTGTDATRVVTPDGLNDWTGGSGAITKVGTIASGTWAGTSISATYTDADANVQSDWNSSSGDNKILNKPSIPSGNSILDWTTSSAGIIHASNYTNTTYSIGDGGLTQKNFTTALNTKLDAIEGADKRVMTDDQEIKLDSCESNSTADQTRTDIEGLGVRVLGTVSGGTWAANKIEPAYYEQIQRFYSEFGGRYTIQTNARHVSGVPGNWLKTQVLTSISGDSDVLTNVDSLKCSIMMIDAGVVQSFKCDCEWDNSNGAINVMLWKLDVSATTGSPLTTLAMDHIATITFADPSDTTAFSALQSATLDSTAASFTAGQSIMVTAQSSDATDGNYVYLRPCVTVKYT